MAIMQTNGSDPATVGTRRSYLWSLGIRWTMLYALAWTLYWRLPFGFWNSMFVPDTLITWYRHGVTWWGELVFGSGTDAFNRYSNFMGLGFSAFVGLVGALIWLAIDRKRAHEDRVYEISRVTMRFVLAAGILGYGSPKIPPMHGRNPAPVEWATLFGEDWRASYMWPWFGYSQAYQTFAGLMEVSGGFLLFFRKTTTIGALLVAAATLNVVLILYGVDGSWNGALTPGHQMLLALILLAPDLRRVVNAFVLGKPTPAAPEHNPWRRWGFYSPSVALKWVVILAWVAPMVRRNYESWRNLQFKSPLYGVYRVERFTRNGQEVPFSAASPSRWRIVAIGNCAEEMTIETVNDSKRLYYLSNPPAPVSPVCERRSKETKPLEGTLSLLEVKDRGMGKTADKAAPFKYRRDKNQLTLEGTLDSAMVVAHMKKIPNDSFALYNKNWWSELK
jgi:hypothetical protein